MHPLRVPWSQRLRSSYSRTARQDRHFTLLTIYCVERYGMRGRQAKCLGWKASGRARHSFGRPERLSQYSIEFAQKARAILRREGGIVALALAGFAQVLLKANGRESCRKRKRRSTRNIT